MTSQDADELIDHCMHPIQWGHHTSDEWQFYIGVQTQRIWETLTFNQKLAIAMDAYAMMQQDAKV
jgi:hypothetical protein